MSKLFSVEGKTALVTGGSSGIGLMIAKAFVEHGVITYIVSRSAQRCSEVASELSSRGGQCYALAADISTNAGIEALVDQFTQQRASLDILVNNAGAMYDAKLEEFSEEGWDQTLDLNLKSVFFLTQKLLPQLRVNASNTNHSSVINIGSVGGLRVGPKENYAYQAAKAGLHHLTGSLAVRLAAENITVNAIAPGFFPSRMTQIPDEIMPQVLAKVPRGRLGGEEDMGGTAIYLASPAASFVTGAVIPLEGGMAL
jgi:NAD(P)-dependent dehydrogenase (short-subunit alcohol dehydrogenase family)